MLRRVMKVQSEWLDSARQNCSGMIIARIRLGRLSSQPVPQERFPFGEMEAAACDEARGPGKIKRKKNAVRGQG